MPKKLSTATSYGPNIHLGDEAISAIWDEDAKSWTVTTANGASYTGDAVIGALGQLNRPNWPAISGKDAFKGAVTHTAEWDHSIPMKGKRVGIIGCAASAVQIIPELAEEVEELVVFQRSPNWVIPRNDISDERGRGRVARHRSGARHEDWRDESSDHL